MVQLLQQTLVNSLKKIIKIHNNNLLMYIKSMSKTETKENYIETIHILSLENENVKAIDIAKYLGFSRATVSVACKKLEKDGYITIEKNKIQLTNKGIKIAKDIYERHEYIAKLLMSLGVDKKTAYEDSCKIEHDISKKSFNAIKKATKLIN